MWICRLIPRSAEVRLCDTRNNIVKINAETFNKFKYNGVLALRLRLFFLLFLHFNFAT